MAQSKVLFLNPMPVGSCDVISWVQTTLLSVTNATNTVSYVTVPWYHDEIPQQIKTHLQQANAHPIGADPVGKQGSPNPSWICRADWKQKYRELQKLQDVKTILAYSSGQVCSFNTGKQLKDILKCKLLVIVLDDTQVHSFVVEAGITYIPIGPKLKQLCRAQDYIIPWHLKVVKPSKNTPPLADGIINIVTFWQKNQSRDMFTILFSCISEMREKVRWNVFADADTTRLLKRSMPSSLVTLNIVFHDNVSTVGSLEKVLNQTQLLIAAGQDKIGLDMRVLQAMQLDVPVLVSASSATGLALSPLGVTAVQDDKESWEMALESRPTTSQNLYSRVATKAKQTMNFFSREATGADIPVGHADQGQQQRSTHVENLFINSAVYYNPVVHNTQNVTVSGHPGSTPGSAQQPPAPPPPPPPDSGPQPMDEDYRPPTQPEQDPYNGRTRGGNPVDHPTDSTPQGTKTMSSKMTADILREIESKDAYDVSHNPRGKALIINVKQFDSRYEPREGSEKDVEELTSLFQDLKFDVIPLIDPTLNALDLFIDDHTSRSDCNALIIWLMSHGGNGHVLTKDMRLYDVDGLLKKLSNSNSTTLVGRPKIVFIQACRGDKPDAGVTVADADVEAVPYTPKLPTNSDMCVVYPCHPGLKSYRNTLDGTWLVQDTVAVFKDHAHDEHILELIPRVTNKVADREHWSDSGATEKACPLMVSSLRKKFYLMPGY